MKIKFHVNIGEGERYNYSDEKEFDTAEELYDFLNCSEFAGQSFDFGTDEADDAVIYIYNEFKEN